MNPQNPPIPQQSTVPAQPAATALPQSASQLDPSVLNLMDGIRQVESGGDYSAKGQSGEVGAYQFMPSTFKAWAGQYIGDQNADVGDPATQNKVAYARISALKAQGYSPSQVASIWNSGNPDPTGNIGTNEYGAAYDTPKYVQSVLTAAQAAAQARQRANPGQQSGNGAIPTAYAASPQAAAQQQPSGGYQPTFAYSQGDSPLTAGLKAAGNIPGSALNFGMGALKSVNPLSTFGTLGQIGSGFSQLAGQEGTSQALLNVIKGLPAATYEALVPQAIKDLVKGDIGGAAQSVTNDPFGQIAPIAFAAEGGLKAADASGLTESAALTFDQAVASVAKPVTATIDATAGLGTRLAASLISHLTSLDPDTISQVLSNPADFSRLAQDSVSRPAIGEEFGNAIDQAIDDQRETGAEYNGIRSSGENVAVPEGFFTNILRKHGLTVEDVVQGNKPPSMADLIGQRLSGEEKIPTIKIGEPKVIGKRVKADTNSITRNPADISALQNFMDNWGSKTNLSPREFLNMRSDIGQLSKFDSAKSGAASTVGKDLYAKANEAMRPQIRGLRDLDERMAPQIEQMKQIKKDFLTKDNEFKDNAVSKMANALNKPGLLARMEKVSPGITRRLQLLRAVEDIRRASGIKVGSYVRGIIEGGAALSGHLPSLIAAVLTNPSIAVQIIRGFGMTGAKLGQAIGVLQMLAGDTSSLRQTAKVGGTVQNDTK